ncbi:MAG: PAS domain-containing protein, partial [Myxococcota bacterium]
DEMLGRRFGEFKRPDVAAKDAATFKNILNGEPIVGYETTYLTKAGEERTLLFNAQVARDVDGKAIGTRRVGARMNAFVAATPVLGAFGQTRRPPTAPARLRYVKNEANDRRSRRNSP